MTPKTIFLALASLSLWTEPQAAPAEGPPVTVSVDPRKTRAPISKYIFGQFIEHLGRCIYGGLWAEMLEDRKFFYPVTGEAPAWELYRPANRSWDGEGHPYELLVRSPWLILGDKRAVTMETNGAYAGQHTPKIRIAAKDQPTGIMQERLGLIEGRRYVGRMVLAGEAGAAPIQVSLVWGGGAGDRQTVTVDRLSPEFAKVPLEFTARGSTDNGRLEIVGVGQGSFLVGAVSLMPADHIYGWRADTLALLRELNAPVYRWPGGNFVSGYDWKDGIGDPDRRPPRKNPAWKGIEANDVGLDEFMVFCRELGTEPYISVNTGLGGAEGAAAELEYANGSASTTQGQLRAKNGHPMPYGVKWWAIGNEMYGDWQLGHMPLKEYVKKHNQVVDAMRAVDPAIRPVAVGSVGEWSKEMLANCSAHMSLLSEHVYWQNKADVEAHVQQAVAGIRKVAEAHRQYRREMGALAGKDIRLAMDEWNYWYGPNEFGELGTRYFLQDGLGIAAGLHEYFRQSDLFFMANYAQTVNVIGAIKTTKTQAEFETTGLVLTLYRRHFGVTPVEVAGDTPPLDVAAALTEDQRALTVAVVNPTPQARRVALVLAGSKRLGPGRRWLLTGPDRWAHNSPGKPRQVDIQNHALAGDPGVVEAPSLSVTLCEWPLQ